MEYDDLGRMIRVIRSDSTPTYSSGLSTPGVQTGLVESRTYDAIGNLNSETPIGGDAQAIIHVYDRMSRMIETRRPTGTAEQTRTSIETYQYNDAGNITAVVDALGHRTESSFDKIGRMTEKRIAVPSGLPLVSSYRYITDANGYREEQTDALGTTSYVSHFDGLGRIVREEMRGDPEKLTTYDEVGNLAGQKQGTWSFVRHFDARNQLASETDAAGNIKRFELDPLGNLRFFFDAAGNAPTEYRYDGQNRRTHVIDALGKTATTTYDLVGNVVGVEDESSNKTTYQYDGLNRLLNDTNSFGTRAMTYDVAGNRASTVDRNGRRMEYQYNRGNQLRTDRWLDASGQLLQTYSYQTDASNRVLGIDDGTISSQFEFSEDAADRLLGQTIALAGQSPFQVTHTPDPLGRPIATELRIGDGPVLVRNTFDRDYSRDRIARITQDGAFASKKTIDVSYSTDFSNRLNQLTRRDNVGNVVSRSALTYDNRGNVGQIVHTASGSNLQTLVYTYNASNEVASHTDAVGSATYSYDALHRLAGVDYANTSTDESYSYDASGNPTQTATSATFTMGKENRILSDGVKNYAYDAEGNLITATVIASGAFREYRWDHRNRLLSVEDKSSSNELVQRVSFAYDGMDRRVRQTVERSGAITSDRLYVHDGDDVLMEFELAANDLVPRVAYLHGPQTDQVFAQDFGGRAYQWLLSDRQGSVRNIIDSTGASLDQIRYDAYGQILSRQNSNIVSNYFYTGRTLDLATGLYYYRARYYEPTLGRFISVDPSGFKGGDDNLYRYAAGNPVNMADPTGLAAAPSAGGWMAGQHQRGSYQNVSARVWGARVANPFAATAMSFGESYKENIQTIDKRIVDSFRDVAAFGSFGGTLALSLTSGQGRSALIHGNLDGALKAGVQSLHGLGTFTQKVKREISSTMRFAGELSKRGNRMASFAGASSLDDPVTAGLAMFGAVVDHSIALAGSMGLAFVGGIAELTGNAADAVEYGLRFNGLKSDRAQRRYYSDLGQAIAENGILLTARGAAESMIKDVLSVPKLISTGNSARIGELLGGVMPGSIFKIAGEIGSSAASLVKSLGAKRPSRISLYHAPTEIWDRGRVANLEYQENYSSRFNTGDLKEAYNSRVLDASEHATNNAIIDASAARVYEYFDSPEVKAKLKGLTRDQISNLERMSITVEISRELVEPGTPYSFGKLEAPDLDQYVFGIKRDAEGATQLRPDLVEESLVHRMKMLDDPITQARSHHAKTQIRQLTRVAGSELSPELRRFANSFETLMGMEGAVGLPRVWENLNGLLKESIHSEVFSKGKGLFHDKSDFISGPALEASEASAILRRIEETFTRDSVMSEIAYKWAIDPNGGNKFGVAAMLERGSFGASVEQFAFRANQIHSALKGDFNPLGVLTGAKETNAYAWRTVADIFKTPMGGSSDFDFNVIILNKSLFEKMHSKEHGHYADSFVNSFYDYAKDELKTRILNEESNVVRSNLESKLKLFEATDRYTLIEIYKQDDKVFRGISDRRSAELADVAKGAHGYVVPLDRVNLGPLISFDKYWYEGLRLRLGKVILGDKLWYTNPTRIGYEGGIFTGRKTELQVLDANYKLPSLQRLLAAQGIYGPLLASANGLYEIPNLNSSEATAVPISNLDTATVLVLGRIAIEHWEQQLGFQNQVDIHFTLADLPHGELGYTQILTRDDRGLPKSASIVIDQNASGLSWWLSQDLLQDIQSIQHVDGKWSKRSKEDFLQSIKGFNGYDLATVLLHEIGHALGFSLSTVSFANRVEADRHGLVFQSSLGPVRLERDGNEIDPNASPEAIMASTLPIGRSKRLSNLDVSIVRAVWNTQDATAQRIEISNKLYLEPERHGGFVPLSNGVGLTLSNGPAKGLCNLKFTNVDPTSDSFGWITAGSISVANNVATVLEASGSMLSDLSQTFVMPSGIKQLKFTLSGIQLDVNSGNDPGDALEIALLDTNRKVSRLPGMNGLTGSDGLLSIQADGRVFTAASVTVTGLASSGALMDLSKPIEVTVDTRSIPANSVNTLYFDLIGLGETDTSKASVSNIRFASIASWHNADMPMDVDNDTYISPLDVLNMINELNAPKVITGNGNKLPEITDSVSPPPYYDVDDDGTLSPLDVLIVINYLNLQNGSPTNGTAPRPVETWQNSKFATDVNDDQSLDPRDVLSLLNEINFPQISDPATGRLPKITNAIHPKPYLDVDNDGSISPLDVLSVINAINRNNGNGEGEFDFGDDHMVTELIEVLARDRLGMGL